MSGPSPSPSGAGVAATRTCGSMPGLSTARDSCKPRLQWSSPRPRWTAATRARDGRSPGSRKTAAPGHSTARDSCNVRPRSTHPAPCSVLPSCVLLRGRQNQNLTCRGNCGRCIKSTKRRQAPTIAQAMLLDVVQAFSIRARNEAARARDGRLQPVPATDGRTQRPRWAQPRPAIDGRARDGRPHPAPAIARARDRRPRPVKHFSGSLAVSASLAVCPVVQSKMEACVVILVQLYE